MADKKIYRSRKDRMIGGVCGGVAEYFNIDPTIVRLVAVLLFFAEGIGILLYIVSWIVIPERPSSTNYHYDEATNTVDVEGYTADEEDEKEKDRKQNYQGDSEEKSEKKTEFERKAAKSMDETMGDNDKSQKTLGIILVGLGSLFLLDNLFPYFRWHRFWPLAIVGFGIILLLKGVSDNEKS